MAEGLGSKFWSDNLETYGYYAGGQWLAPVCGDYIASEDPFRAEPWAQIPRCQAEDVDKAVRAAHDAFATGPWGRMSATDRGKMIRRLGAAMAAHADRLAEIETRDNGKRVVDILPGLTGGLVETFEYYAGIADKLQGAVIPTGQSGIFNYTKHEPFGVVACITAWNSPLLIATWKIAPALAAGNTVVLKSSEFASASTLELMKAFEDADLPPGVLNVVTGYGDEAGEALVNHPLVRKVSFTGSLQGGCKVAKIAARTVKSVTMELGGKSPQILFADADLDAAVKGVVGGIFPPAGQSCIAGSRLLVEAPVHDEVLDRIAQMARKARLGPPSDPRTHVGPIANRQHFERVLSHIESARDQGAQLVLGGNAAHPGGAKGWFIEPTIFADVTPDMPLAQDEIFGPVLAVLKFENDGEAIEIANGTIYGLAAGIWTEDYRRALTLADAISAGTIYINNYFNACPMSPVGGYGQSGYGRENGWDGLREFVQTKSVWLSTARGADEPFPV